MMIISALLFCSAVFSQNDDKANVLAVERSTADAFTKHNISYLNSAFTDDVIVITSKGEMINKQQLLQYLPNINSVTVSDMQAKILGTTAIVTGIELETGKNDAGAYSAKYRFTDVLAKNKGQWQIISSQATSMDQQ